MAEGNEQMLLLKENRSRCWLTGDDSSSERGEETHADEDHRDQAASLMTLKRHAHEQTHSAVNEERREETPEEHPVPHFCRETQREEKRERVESQLLYTEYYTQV